MDRSRSVITALKRQHGLTGTVRKWLVRRVGAERICSPNVVCEKHNDGHYNRLNRSGTDRAEHWRYSRARSYAGQSGFVAMGR